MSNSNMLSRISLTRPSPDDNVHYQQSMMLARAMEEADVLFRCHARFIHRICYPKYLFLIRIYYRQLSYPDEAHGLVGLRPHFYHALTDFLLNDCFGRNEVITG